MSKFQWKIVRDRITTEPGDKSRAGREFGRDFDPNQAMPVKFKLYDDDDNLYYEGVMTLEAINGPEAVAFAPLNWAMNDAGCTRMDYRMPGVGQKWETL